MSSAAPRLCHQAWQELPPRYRDALPPIYASGTPQDIVKIIEKEIELSKGKPIVTLQDGRKFFVRDALGKIASWIRRFVEVGDTLIQYDPGHAALPWAALRLLLQASINNLGKHAAILEGVDAIARWLGWIKIQETTLDAQLQTHPDLESDYQKLYKHVLTLLARAQRFLQKGKAGRLLASFYSSDSKFRTDIDSINRMQSIIKEQTRSINDSTILKHTQLLLELQQPTLRIEASVQLALDGISRIEQGAILDWTSEIPYEKHHRNTVRNVLNGTGAWLLQDPVYLNWQNSSSSEILWLHGGPGFGKSSLLSIVIQTLIESHESCQTPYPMYSYCSRNTAEPERADPESILRSLVRQASDLPGGPPLHRVLQQRYEKRRTAGTISIDDATDIITATIAERQISFILVDALDECNQTLRYLLIEALEKILHDSTSLVKIFVTSREYYSDITIPMERYPEMRIDATRNQKDVETYVRETVANAVRRRKLLPTEKVPHSLQQQIVETLCSGAKGMFRWVELQLEYLYTIKVRSVLLDRLGKLPPGLEQSYNELYDLKMVELGKLQGGIVNRILSWILVARRRLRTIELRQLSLTPTDTLDSITNETVLDLCFNLVSLDSEQDQFRFSHPSVREFLENKSSEFRAPILHNMAVAACLELINKPQTYDLEHYAATHWPFHAELSEKSGGLLSPSQSQQRRQFLCQPSDSFAGWCRMMHDQLSYRYLGRLPSRFERRIRECIVVDSEARFICASFGLVTELSALLADIDSESILHSANRGGWQLLHLASYSGHQDVVKLLLERCVDANAYDVRDRSPLMLASERGHQEVVSLLLVHGADWHSQGNHALSAATEGNHFEVVTLLLDHGVDIDARPGANERTALQVAVCRGSLEMVRLLLERGADVHAKPTTYVDTPLQEASERRYPEIAKLLLAHGANINARDGQFHLGALQAAAERGHREMVKLLLERGAEVNVPEAELNTADRTRLQERYYWVVERLQNVATRATNAGAGASFSSPIRSAILKIHMRAIKWLLEVPASSGPQDAISSMITFHAAFRRGFSKVIELIIYPNQDVTDHAHEGFTLQDLQYVLKYSKKDDGLWEAMVNLLNLEGKASYALCAASSRGQLEVVKLLLEAGADIDARGGELGNALQAASANGHREVVELLLNAGSNVDAQGGNCYQIALREVSGRGRQDDDWLLLEAGLYINLQGDTALQVASQKGHGEIVRLLLGAGAQLDTQRDNTLLAVSCRGDREIVKMLLEAGEHTDFQRNTALRVASWEGHQQIVGLLLSAGADVHAHGASLVLDLGRHVFIQEGDALHAALDRGHEEVVKLLLDAGAVFDAQGGNYATTLQESLERGHDLITSTLLDGGVASSRDPLGCSLIHFSARRNSCKGIELAIRHGTEVNELDNWQWTPLHWAAYFGESEAVRELLRFGADMRLEDWQGRTPLSVGLFSGHSALEDVLLKARRETDGHYGSTVPDQRIKGECDSCTHDLLQVQHHCTVCDDEPGYDLCFRCFQDVENFHPGHKFTQDFRY